ncbi:hypothetical protein SDC9_171214 [bioreactor metagenome]|uniref:Uncharacterized protein n=1 Tax=bioreactor metagenome TaxID=1076179 RepID=A0A645GA92_9ZZZZ
MSEMSFSVKAGKLTYTSGIFMPLLELTAPPFITSHSISVSLRVLTLSSISPSSISILLPFTRSFGRSLYVTLTVFSLPIISFVVRVKVSPGLRFMQGLPISFILISGPFVSKIRGMGALKSPLAFLRLFIMVLKLS